METLDLDDPDTLVTRGYGFLESISKSAGESPYARINIVLDAVDAQAFDESEAIYRDDSVDHLSIVRIMTTVKRLRDLFDLNADFSEGDWFEFALARSSGRPRAWLLKATADYGSPIVSTNLVGLERITRFGVAGASKSTLDKLKLWCKPVTTPEVVPSTQFPKNLFVRVVDVGHASFSAIHVDRTLESAIVGYYDVGGPVYFHSHTFPKYFAEQTRIPESGFVALSHWDFDHYSLALTKLKPLQNLIWYAPDQFVGPNAARLQRLLGPRLNLINASMFSISTGLNFRQGTGAATDRNACGYVLTVPNASGDTLLTGDVPYNHVPAIATSNIAALSITHHGGRGSGTPPTPTSGRGVAAVSFGLPNRYHHPDTLWLNEHTATGWIVQPTFSSSTARGDVWLP